MINWIQRNKRAIIRSAFLVPIFFVVAISISHVVSWYDLANPISWAIYLSIAIEIAALAAIAAASVRVKGFSIWFVFSIVTLVQFIGNIFFCYTDIDVTSKFFKDWIELTQPITEGMGMDITDIVAQKRFLALLEGGLLPLISLTCLHFFIKYGDQDETKNEGKIDTPDEPAPESEYIDEEESEEKEDVLPNDTTEPRVIPKTSAEDRISPSVTETEKHSELLNSTKPASKKNMLSHKMTNIMKNNQTKK